MRFPTTPWETAVCSGDNTAAAGVLELQDLARGLAGALFVSLPLLFTMEMWVIARSIPDWVLVAFLCISIALNKLYLDFAGFRKRAWQESKWWDALVAFGIGCVASAITLIVIGSISPALDTYLAVKLVALEAIPMSLGAAVAINQLGGGDSGDATSGLSADWKVLLGNLLGGYLFALNIAPTVEPKVITLQQNWVLTGATLILALGISYLTVALACFEQRDLSERRVIDSEWLEALSSYLIAFAVSSALLFVFGFATPFDPLSVWLPQAVALSYATALGGAAGRLVL